MRTIARTALSASLAASGALAMASPATAAPGDPTTGKSGRTFVESGLPVTLPAAGDVETDGACDFPVTIAEVHNNEYSKATPNGGSRISGRLVVSFTNTDTGVSVIRNISGPGLTTEDPSGSVTIRNRGTSAWPVFESTENEVLSRGIYVIHGWSIFVDFAPSVVNGRVEDICETLS